MKIYNTEKEKWKKIREITDYGKTNSNLKVGEIASQSTVSLAHHQKIPWILGLKNSYRIFRNPEQTPHVRNFFRKISEHYQELHSML